MRSGVIHSIMFGRLGNQLFKYAFARALQLKFYPDYHININFYHYINYSEQEKRQGFINSLKDFKISSDVTYNCDNTKKIRTPLQFIFAALRLFLEKILSSGMINRLDTKLFQPLFNKAGLYNPLNDASYVRPLPSRSKIIICASNFEAYKYFDDIRDILLDEFTPIHDVLPHNRALLEEIKKSESVCVTIRRGDFLSEKYISELNVCSSEYFNQAMKEIQKEIPNCKFFIFSDDIEDVKKTMNFPDDAVYESGDDPVWEKLRLMYSCKHFIISNSTFSWWAQYLSRNENKIVYAPSPWHWGSKDYSGIYTPNMRTIKCRCFHGI